MKLDNYECDGQMSIFDFLQSEKPKQSTIKKINIPNLAMPFPCRECKWCDDLVCENNRKPKEYGECELFCSRTPYFDTMSVEEAAERIRIECGVDFKKGFCYSEENENAIEYTAKHKKMTINIHFSHFDEIHNSRRFLALDITNSRQEGFGSPCLSIEEAVREIKQNIDRLQKQEKKKSIPVDIRGLCDDAYCPSCGYGFLDRETDLPECPICKTKVDWSRWHIMNDEEETI